MIIRPENRPTDTARLLFAIVIGSLLFAARQARSQEALLGPESTTLRSILSQKSETPDDVNERLDALIQSTQRAREERQTAMSTLDETNASAATNNVTPPAEESLRDQMEPAVKSARSLSEIRERIRILQRLRRDRQINNQARVSPAPIPSGISTPTFTPQRSDRTENGNLPEAASNSPATEPTAEQMTESMDAASASTSGGSADDPRLPSKPSLSGRVIVPEAVNKMGLGESLYRTGNFEAALKALQAVDANRLTTSERTWLDLLIALCQRRVGETEKAEGTLRDIANAESTDYPVQAAKWWLKHTQSSSQTLTRLNDLTKESETLLERAQDYVK